MNSELDEHSQWMSRALELAKKAENLGEVPVGALVVCDGEVIGEGYNQPISTQDPTGHAEIIALRKAAKKLANYRLPNCSLYVTIEPCSMCAGAIIHSRIEQVFFGALEPRAGAIASHFHLFDATNLNHQVYYEGGILAEQCSELMTGFFQRRRKKLK